MHKGGKKTEISSFLIQEPSMIHTESSKIPTDDIERELDAAMEAGDNAHVLEVLDAAPRWMREQSHFILLRASLLLASNKNQEALQLLRELERKKPSYLALYLPLAMLYMDMEWPAHALQAAKRALTDRNLTDKNRILLDELIEEATEWIQLHATAFKLSFEVMQRAYFFHERAQIAMEDNKLSEVDYYAKEAIKIVPDWNPPHNNRAQALFYSGRISEAISVLEAVLVREADNTFALGKLVLYHLSLNQPEQAQVYANRLKLLSKKIPADSIEVEQIIMSLALIEDTPALWKIAKKYLDAPADFLYSRSWQCLAVAAIRSGKWNDALTLIMKANEEDLSPGWVQLLDKLEVMADQHQPSLAWMPPAYPVADFFFHPKIIKELEILTKDISDTLSPSQKSKLDRLIQKYPFLVVGMRRHLWDEESHPGALQILALLENPEADAEILRFALSQTGSRQTRLHAMSELLQSGRYTGPKVVKLWDEDLNEWRDVELNFQKIGAIKPNAQPKTMALIKKSQKAGDLQEAIALLKKAVELEPTSPIANFNLGVKLAESGKVNEGGALILHSVEVDPDYTYGHASIAISEAEKNHERAALDHLAFVTKAEVIAPETALIANIAWVILALHKDDLKSARQRLELAAQIDPEYRLVKRFERILADAEEYEENNKYVLEFQRKSTKRAHQKLLKTPLTAEMSLLACLETNTKEMLVGCAHFLRTASSGRKAELASWLAEVLLDPEFLQETLEEDLEEIERSALQWMLEADGVRPWKEFVRKYGDDMDEPTNWDYLEPESIPGRLRVSGLLYSGILDNQLVAFIPADARKLLRKLLK